MHCNLLKLNYVCAGNTQVKLYTSRLLMLSRTENLTQVKKIAHSNLYLSKLKQLCMVIELVNGAVSIHRLH